MPNRFISDLTGTMRSFFKIGTTLRLKNNSGTLEVCNGDDTARAPLNAGKLTLGGAAVSQKLNVDGHIYFDKITAPIAPTAALAGLGAGNLSNGDYLYTVTFVNAEGETGLGSGAWVTVTNNALNGQVRLTNIPTGPTNRDVTARRIYRSKVGGVGSYLLTTVNNNTTTTYTDNIPDTSLTTEYHYLRDNTTAGAVFAAGERVFFPGTTNLFVGRNAGISNTNGYNNTFVGGGAGQMNSVGVNHTFLGAGAGYGNTTGTYNTFLGQMAGYSNTSGSGNVFCGSTAGYSNVTGNHNTFLGHTVGFNNTGSYNTFVGSWVGNNNVGANYNTALGYMAGPSSAAYVNTTCLGANSTVTGSNQLQLGDASTTAYAYGAVQNRSDARWKEQIEDVPVGLDFILRLKPRQYKMKDFTVPAAKQVIDGEEREIAPAREYKFARKHYGLIGQEVKQAMDALGVDFGGYQDHSVNGGEDVLTLGYTEFIAPIIKAIQELHVQVEDHGKQLAQLGPRTRRSI